VSVQTRLRKKLEDTEHRITMLKVEQGNGRKHEPAIAGMQRYADHVAKQLREVELGDAE
jgi:hypothetical protein